MFLYNNTIVSENTLTPNLEPHDFFSASMQCNKKLISASIEASKHMLDVLTTYGTKPNIVKEALSDYTKAVYSEIHDFNTTTITESKMWLDDIVKSNTDKNGYVYEALNHIYMTNREVLKEFTYELPVHEDLGFGVFGELSIPKWFNTVDECVSKVKSDPECDMDEIRSTLSNATENVTTGLEAYQIDINTLLGLYNGKQNADKSIKGYKDKCIEIIASIEHAILNINDTDPASCQKKCMGLAAIATCVNEHMCIMFNKYNEATEKFDSIAKGYIPAAEEYLLSDNK